MPIPGMYGVRVNLPMLPFSKQFLTPFHLGL